MNRLESFWKNRGFEDAAGFRRELYTRMRIELNTPVTLSQSGRIALIQLARNAFSPANHSAPLVSRLITLSSRQERTGVRGATPLAR